MAAKKASEAFSRALIEEVQRWGAMKQTGVSLRYMMDFGSNPSEKNLLLSAQFLHKELPIRIARRAIELESLPFGLSEKPAVLKVFDCLGFVLGLILEKGFWFLGHVARFLELGFDSHGVLWCFSRSVVVSFYDGSANWDFGFL